MPLWKGTFLFTQEELEALEDLKLDLRRKYDLKTTKNELARCALQGLLEDYYQRSGSSDVLRRLKKKATR